MDPDRFIAPDQRAEEDLHDSTCQLCHRITLNPTQCPENHLFCSNCIHTYLTSHDTCPISQHALTPDDLQRNALAERLISRLTISCENRHVPLLSCVRKRLRQPPGCRWTGRVRDVEAHRAVCQFRAAQCADCLVFVPLVGLGAHRGVCGARRVLCASCGAHVPAAGLSAHVERCPAVCVPCPRGCVGPGGAVRVMKRSTLEGHRAVCAREVVECEFHDLGCAFRGLRGDLKRHVEGALLEHLGLLRRGVLELRSARLEAVVDARKVSGKAERMAEEKRTNIAAKVEDCVEWPHGASG